MSTSRAADVKGLSLTFHFLPIRLFVQPSVHQSFQMLKDAPAETATKETVGRAEKSTVVELLLQQEEKCSEKMKRDPPYSRSGRRLSVLTFSFYDASCL